MSSRLSRRCSADSQTEGLPYVPSAIAYRGQYVLVKDGGLLTAFEAKTGRITTSRSGPSPPVRYYASPVAANGLIYFTSLVEGIVTVVKAGAETPEVMATNSKLGERTSATPAIANDTLYIRTEKHLYSFAEK